MTGDDLEARVAALEKRVAEIGGVPLPQSPVIPVDPAAPPRFRDPATLTREQRTDPDYALKELEKVNKKLKRPLRTGVGCSKCHHCR